MKTHLAAVILSGFYLITPPCHYPCTGDKFPDTRAPLSRWTLIQTYDTAAQCEEGEMQNYQRAIDKSPNPPTSFSIADNRFRQPPPVSRATTRA